MNGTDETIQRLKQELAARDEEIQRLRQQLALQREETKQTENLSGMSEEFRKEKLDNADIARYSRQLILPELGVQGQLRLANGRVLIIGAGGLGCPAAQYLAAAGVGRIGIIDYDKVEISNLHRQILHTEDSVGTSKAESVAARIASLNSSVTCIPYKVQLTSSNALDIIKQYDVILDATDNVASRYLINDACVLAGKPLVSGSALRFEGQLTVYNHGDGPCYRCMFPVPPPPESVTSCGDGGVLGVVPGIIGSLQALQAISILAKLPVFSQKMLLFDGHDLSFRIFKLRPRAPNCAVCGDNPTVTQLIDYLQFCGAGADDKDNPVKLLLPEERITCQELEQIQSSQGDFLLVDVREPVELGICQLPGAINIPFTVLERAESLELLKKEVEKSSHSGPTLPVYVLCRRGNDSQKAVVLLRRHLADLPVTIQDISGGLHAWAKDVDTNFPVY